jgi:ApbE superfamily uncharacterized protein (UPF0280 family)
MTPQMAPQRAFLRDGRLHFSHGPIDLVIQADGHEDAIRKAHQRAWHRFETVLPELVSELPALQRPVGDICNVTGSVAQRMWYACYPFRAGFITSMAAVAGSVAQEIIRFYEQPGIDRAAVNNGGDIALYLSAGASFRIGICTDIATVTGAAMHGALQADGAVLIESQMPIRGIATSGWRGRSFSLGIADSVTVLAATAARADAAATVIANAVNVEDARIKRIPARDLKDNTDLGGRLVTADVPWLELALVRDALRSGLAQARRLQEAGLIESAVISCQGQVAHLHEGGPELRKSQRQRSGSPEHRAERLLAVTC